MKRKKAVEFCFILVLALLLAGCSKLGIGKEAEESMDKYIKEDVSVLASLQADNNFNDCSTKIVINGTEANYKDLNGVVDVLNLYASPKGTEASIKYKADFISGDIRVALINGNNEAVDILKGNGEGDTKVKVVGNSKIRCVGSNATGNLRIEVKFGQQAETDSLSANKFDKDGDFLLYEYKITDGKLTGKLYRVYVVNKKAEKVAKINLTGAVQNGSGTFQFSDDGWGNSGTVEFQYLGKNQEQFKVKVTDRKNAKSQWGFEDCVITPGDEPIPEYLKGL